MKNSDSSHSSGEDPVTGQDQTVFVDVPTELGPYRLGRILGRGGMGEVWQAFDTNLERDVAVKLMRRELLANEEAVRRFGREARAVARLNHSNIVQVYAFGDQKGVLYFVMEMVEGETVGDVVKRHGCLPLDQATLIMLQSVEGLSYASVRGIVHRDIKPSNLMITPDARIKIADFGLARMMEQDSQVTAAGSTMGSPSYMSPEQARGEEADHRSDIYSLGITFYQILTGQLPFTAHTPLSVLLMHIQNPFPEPEFLKELADGRALSIIKRMTQKKAVDRYQTYAELAADLALLAPNVRVGHSAYAGTMSMPTPGPAVGDTPGLSVPPSGPGMTGTPGTVPAAPAAPGLTGSLATAVGAMPATATTPSAISEGDLFATGPGSLAGSAGTEPGATRTMVAHAPAARGNRRAAAFTVAGVSLLGVGLLGFYLWSQPAGTGAGMNATPDRVASLQPAEIVTATGGTSAGTDASGAAPPGSDSTTSTVIAAASSPVPSPAAANPPTAPGTPPAPAGSPGLQPIPTGINPPVAAGQTAQTPPIPDYSGAAPTPPLYVSNNIPVIGAPTPTPVPTPRPTPAPLVARYAELAPDKSPNTAVQIYDAQAQPAFALAARTRVEYLEAATLNGRAMVHIAHDGRRGYVPLELANPLYAEAGSTAAPPPASEPSSLPRTIMAGKPGGSGKIDIFEKERPGKSVHSVPPGTVLDVLNETRQTWVVRLPNGRSGHLLKSLSTKQP